MSWYQEFAPQTKLDAPLGKLTWFQLGGPARYLLSPRDERELAAMLARCRQEALPVRVLGGGANVLVRDRGFDGVVIRLDQPSFRSVEVTGDRVRVGAGVDLMPLVKQMAHRGLAGLEGLAGIPGTVGGAIRMNAGGRYGEIADVIRSVRLVGPDGCAEEWPRERVGFGYRTSGIGDRIVVSAQMELRMGDPAEVTRRYEVCLATKTAGQPMADRSAGCIFKNPPGASAGALIDRAGLKGKRLGGARVSERHANFIVADAGAESADVLALIDLIRDEVRSKWGTELEVEVDIW